MTSSTVAPKLQNFVALIRFQHPLSTSSVWTPALLTVFDSSLHLMCFPHRRNSSDSWIAPSSLPPLRASRHQATYAHKAFLASSGFIAMHEPSREPSCRRHLANSQTLLFTFHAIDPLVVGGFPAPDRRLLPQWSSASQPCDPPFLPLSASTRFSCSSPSTRWSTSSISASCS